MAKDMTEPGDGPLAGPDGKPEWAMSRRERRRAERARAGLPPPHARWPWVLLALVALAAGAGAWAWRAGHLDRFMPAEEAAEPAEPAAPRPKQVNQDEWATVEPRTLRRTVRVIGPLQPARRADLSAETGGTVEAVAARPGDAVEAGAVLVTLDVERLGLDVEQARSNLAATQAQLDVAQGQFDRASRLVERGVAAETTLDDLRGSLEGLRAQLGAQEDAVRGAELALEGATVRAPFAGVVASRTVEPGAVVAPGAPLLGLVDLGTMEMLGSAPVAAGARLRPGQAVAIEVDGVDGRTFEGTVSRVAPVATEGTRTVTVFVDVPNDGTLIGGMFATGQVVIAEAANAIAVPADAVLTDDEGTYVLAIAGDALARRPVTVVAAWGELAQVEGIAAGEAVVTSALSGLEPGQAVERVEF